MRRIEGHYYLIIFQNILLESYRQDMADAEFHFFPRLPAELRLKVWTFARPAPRLIHAHIKTGYELYFTLPGEVCLLVPHVTILGRKAPSVLQVCKESRALLPPGRTRLASSAHGHCFQCHTSPEIGTLSHHKMMPYQTCSSLAITKL